MIFLHLKKKKCTKFQNKSNSMLLKRVCFLNSLIINWSKKSYHLLAVGWDKPSIRQALGLSDHLTEAVEQHMGDADVLCRWKIPSFEPKFVWFERHTKSNMVSEKSYMYV